MGTNKVENISRLRFLKNTGIMAAGLTFLPDLLRAEFKDSLLARQVNQQDITDYQIIIPLQANAIEKEAALQLQKYLSKLSLSGKFQSQRKGNLLLRTVFSSDKQIMPKPGKLISADFRKPVIS